MKKILLVLFTSFTCLLNAEIGENQFYQFSVSTSQSYGRALDICQEREFGYFVFKRISYSDESGQTLEFKGVTSAEDGELIVETIEPELNPAFGKQKIEFEIFCFKEAPKGLLAVDVQELFDCIAMMREEPSAQATEMSKVREITTLEELEKEIASANGPLYLDCYSTMCPPCKMLAPRFDQYSIDLASKGTFLNVNVDTVSEVGDKYKIKALPTLLIFEDNEEPIRKAGLPEILKYFASLKD